MSGTGGEAMTMDAAAAGGETVVRGRALGVDVGRARVGLATSDPDGLLATPVETLRRDRRQRRDVDELAAHARELEAVVVYVGLPRNLRGEHTESTRDAEEYAAQVAEVTGLPVRLVDERLTTVTAQAGLHRAGRTVKDSRSVVDQAAAVAILQDALEAQRRTGRWAGAPVVSDGQGEQV